MINQYIPLYDLLTGEEKTEFERTDDGQELLVYLQRGNQRHQPFRVNDTFAARANINVQRAQAIQQYITEKAPTSEAFKRLQAQIIAKFFPELELTDGELSFLVSRDYSAGLLSSADYQNRQEIWVQAFCADASPEAQAIQREIFEYYDGIFGFLFKNRCNLQKLLEMIHTLSFKSLQEVIHNQWPDPASCTERFLTGVEDSLGFLLKNPANITQKYANDICNAHMVYRFLGLSSENMVLGLGYEGVPIPYVNLLDLYNYHQNRIAIGEALGILQTLGIPFRVFFNEYADIARFEDNPLVICLRAFLPFLVMGVILSFAYTLLLPLAAHAFLEYLLFIPTLYFSIAAAGVYIQYKNSTYTAMLEWWYGSLYMAPQFHANQRIESAFLNDEALSTQVARYYANSLEACDRIEQYYATCLSETGLNDEQMLKRNNNRKLKFDLYMEWYDLHDRQDLGTNRIPGIVLARLSSDERHLRKKLKEYSDTWCDVLDKKQSFFDKPTFREKFNGLKQSLSDIKALESAINDHLEHAERSAAYQERTLDDLC
ncbi:MAG: hypothetical protein GW760_01815 [Legionella sp.]|jgi:hypothetical protein|nr:hypothetical protein [Legionella sp.]